MNAVKIRKWYEERCLRCFYYKILPPNYGKDGGILAVCTAPKQDVDWILSTKKKKYALIDWFPELMEDCRFKERGSK